MGRGKRVHYNGTENSGPRVEYGPLFKIERRDERGNLLSTITDINELRNEEPGSPTRHPRIFTATIRPADGTSHVVKFLSWDGLLEDVPQLEGLEGAAQVDISSLHYIAAEALTNPQPGRYNFKEGNSERLVLKSVTELEQKWNDFFGQMPDLWKGQRYPEPKFWIMVAESDRLAQGNVVQARAKLEGNKIIVRVYHFPGPSEGAGGGMHQLFLVTGKRPEDFEGLEVEFVDINGPPPLEGKTWEYEIEITR